MTARGARKLPFFISTEEIGVNMAKLHWLKGPCSYIALTEPEETSGIWKAIKRAPSSAMDKVARTLIGLHGNRVVTTFGHHRVVAEVIAALGKTVNCALVRVKPGGHNDCHERATRMWIAAPSGQLWTGYALNGDTWRTHSWYIDTDEILHEPTLRRESYHGVALTDELFRLSYGELNG